MTASLDSLKGSTPPLVTPYYIRPPQRGLVAYYLELATISNLPWMVYHIPGRTAINVTIDTLEELRAKSPTFVGMKHAVNDLGFVSECISALGKDFKVFVGLEELSFPMMAVGACGLMNAVGNLQPRVLADLCDAVWSSDLPLARSRAAPGMRSGAGAYRARGHGRHVALAGDARLRKDQRAVGSRVSRALPQRQTRRAARLS